MQNAVQRSIRILLVSFLISVSIATSTAFAQSGSAGGSIGNDEKSLSGSRQAPRSVDTEKPARRSKPEADEPRRVSRKSGGGGGGSNFDGVWVVVATGTTCSGSSTTAVIVTSGKIIGEGLSGTISPSGAARSVGNYGGITVVSTGRASGRNGSGTFRRSDGCIGTWTSSKQ
jgi:hypothetical protein